MQNEKIDILTFADHPLPAYDVRPYRSALFIDAAPRDFGSRIFVIAPEGIRQLGESFPTFNIRC